MRSFEIFVAPEPSLTDSLDVPTSGPRRRGARSLTRGEVLDVFIEGANVTARVTERQAGCVLRDLGTAVAELGHAPWGKKIVRFYEEAWELAIERDGAKACLSVYRAGNEPKVFVYDRWVSFRDVIEGVNDALGRAIDAGSADATVSSELARVREALGEMPGDDARAPESVAAPVVLEVDRDAALGFSAEFSLRARRVEESAHSGEPVERADLHALLFPGRLRAEVRGRTVDLGDAHPFLFAERLLQLARRTLDAWERGLPLHVRTDAGGPLVGIRLASSTLPGDVDTPTNLALVLGAKSIQTERATHTFPALSIEELVDAAISFGRALVRALLRRDRTQAQNLRLSAFRRDLRELGEALRDASRQDSMVNPAPEHYRAFVAPPRERTEAPARPARLRYAQRWRALVPGIDLRGTFLCGDRLVVGTSAETFCLARATGEVIWRTATPRATSVVTPSGLARLLADGTLDLHDFRTGEVTVRARLAPRIGGPAAGAVVQGSGLPKLLVVTEGERHLVAIDLATGEARWRFAWGRGGTVRMKRSGKLLYLCSGDSALAALDVTNGTVVWRLRDRLRFRVLPTLDHDDMFAVAGGTSSATQAYSIDPFSGQVRWRAPLDPGTVEGIPLAGRGVVAFCLRRPRGLDLIALDRATGRPRWRSMGPVVPSGTSWLVVDDLLIGNTPTGELLAIEAETGRLRYRHVLGRVLEADTPRRLEPVLRSGAVFVPHVDVHVFRPSDGGLLAHIGPCDAIPDLLRVDERCDVYVAEESGHLVSFSAGPRLALV